jgi:hypothetical protein
MGPFDKVMVARKDDFDAMHECVLFNSIVAVAAGFFVGGVRLLLVFMHKYSSTGEKKNYY